MGSGRFTPSDWASYSSTHVTGKTSVDEIYTARGINPAFDPREIKVRESCDSADNPNSSALIVAADVTGSMDAVLDSLIREALPTLVTEIYSRKPISDPHMMLMGVGDVEAGDRAPLQATQFEADIRIAEQLTKLWFERGGGGNNHESYLLPLWFAANHTRIDCMEKRSHKGYLFTLGDEGPQMDLRAIDIERVFGYRPQFDSISAQDIITMASRQYHIFHLIIEQGNYCRCYGDRVQGEWSKLYGQRALPVADISKIAEIIVSAIQVNEGTALDKVVDSWDGSTGLVVAKAVSGLTPVTSGNNGLVTF